METEELNDIQKRIPEALYILKVLSENGVDVSTLKITRFDKKTGKQVFRKLNELEQRGVDIEEIIKDNKLDPDFPIGRIINIMRTTYNKIEKGEKHKYVMTKESQILAEKLGVVGKRPNLISKTLEILRVLKENGVDLGKFKITGFSNGKQKNRLLKDVEPKEVIDRLIEENEWDPNFPLGYNIRIMRECYKLTKLGREAKYILTEEQQTEFENSGALRLSKKMQNLISAKKIRDEAKAKNDNAKSIEAKVNIELENGQEYA